MSKPREKKSTKTAKNVAVTIPANADKVTYRMEIDGVFTTEEALKSFAGEFVAWCREDEYELVGDLTIKVTVT